jgi:glucose-6-phosphate-specific signal transduction histidine kinase
MIAFWIFVVFMVGLTCLWGVQAWSANDRATAVIVWATSIALATLVISGWIAA